MNFNSRRIIALFLLFMTITGVVMAFGENVSCAGELPGAHKTASASHEFEMVQTSDSGGPCAPSHSPDDHFCIGDCGCPCHAPLPSAPIVLTFSRSFTSRYCAETARYTPEVYLSLFVPPDSKTI